MKLSQDPESKENDAEAEFLLADLDSDYDDDDGEGQEFVEKIYYASRTHSQLSQVNLKASIPSMNDWNSVCQGNPQVAL